jgi:hypothetical protein
MKTITAIAANKLVNFLTRDFRQICGSACDDEAERIGSAARSAIECLAAEVTVYTDYSHHVGCFRNRIAKMENNVQR